MLYAHADLVVKAVTHRIEVTPQNPDWHIEYELGELTTRLSGSPVNQGLLRQMAERAMSIGIHNAASWLR